MRCAALFVPFAVLVAVAARAQEKSPLAAPAGRDRIELHLLFVGTAEDAKGRAAAGAKRTREYVEFLRGEFGEVRAADRDHFDPKCADAADADVVLLDWSQQSADLEQMSKLASPLGPRDEWETPTVLLGSAGLLIGIPWQIKGGFG